MTVDDSLEVSVVKYKRSFIEGVPYSERHNTMAFTKLMQNSWQLSL